MIAAVLAAGGFLRVDGAGRLSWATPQAIPSGLREGVRRYHDAIKRLVLAHGGEMGQEADA